MTFLPDASPELIAQAMRPRLEFGRGLLAEVSRRWGRYLLSTMPEPWDAARSMLAEPPFHRHFVESMDRAIVGRVHAELPLADTVVGLGGGTALDMAKYVAWRRGVEPVLAPAIASVDTCVTNTIAIRDEGKVRYIGFIVPQTVLADFDLLQSAPLHLTAPALATSCPFTPPCGTGRQRPPN